MLTMTVSGYLWPGTRKKGKDFNELLYSLLDKRNSRELTFVDNALLRECLKEQEDGSSPNIQAMKLFYQRTGALDLPPYNRSIS